MVALDFKIPEMNQSGNVSSEPFAFIFNGSNISAAILVALQIILNLVGNIMVVVCFYHFHHLRTKCNYFIISLSMADICVALFAMPFWLVLQLTNDMERDYKYIISPAMYRFWSSMDILVGTASITNLAAVSFDRQLAITSPFRYQRILTHNRVIVVIIATWIYSIIITSGRVLGTQKFLLETYIPLVVTFGCFLPLFSMIIMYSRIYFVARSQAVRLGNYSRDIKAAKTIAIVIGTFLVCWLPFFLITLSVYLLIMFTPHVYRPELIPALRAIKWMAYFNSCLNPIIYTCLNRPYRRAFHQMFRRCFRGKGYDAAHNPSSNYVSEYQRPVDHNGDLTRLTKEPDHSSETVEYKKQNAKVTLMNGSGPAHGV